MAKKKIDIDKYASGLFQRTEDYADKVRQHYATAVDELLKLSANSHISPDEVFSFADNKKLSEKANNVLRGLYSAVYNEIKGGIVAEWEFANLSCDALIESIFGKGLNEDNHFARWFSRNQEAMDAFFKRKSAYGGMNLSQKVWRYTGDLKTEMELALSLSLGQGDSASTVSRKVRQYLQEPDKLFRHIRIGTDANGNPLYKLSKAAKAYHPGRGVYRSSYKNAMRLTRTETNMAYKTAEQDRWQRLDFVVGYEIKTSNNHPEHDICDELKGKYPKDFVFKGWHPQCRCFTVPILATDDEFIEIQKKILAGEDISNNHYSNEIKDVPDKFSKWIEKNKERINKAESLPYFIKDNFVDGNVNTGLIIKKTGNVIKAKNVTDIQISQEDIELEKTLGIAKGEPMTFEEANELKGNPHYIKGSYSGYTINCQSCVVANELRRRGFDVEAMMNTKHRDNISYILSLKTEKAWIDPKTRKMPTIEKVTVPIGSGNNWKVSQAIERHFRNKLIENGEIKDFLLVNDPTEGIYIPNGRYHLRFYWKGQSGGHIITFEKLGIGEYRFYDPQNGRVFDFSNYFMVDYLKPIELYRVDNLVFNPEFSKVVAKAGTTKPNKVKYAKKQNGWLGTMGENDRKIVFTKDNTFLEYKNGGKVTTHESRILNANKNKQEVEKFEKELRMAKTFAKNGYRVELLEEIPGISSPDAIINGKKVDFKSLSSANNIIRHAKETVRRQGADFVYFEFENKEKHKFLKELNVLSSKYNIHGKYYFKGEDEIFDF